MAQVSIHKIVFYAAAALAAGFFTPLLLRMAAIAGPENPWPVGVSIGLALASLTAFFRWFFQRQFRKQASDRVWLWVAIGAAVVTAFGYVANWPERLAWLVATGAYVVSWLLYGLLRNKASKER